MNSNAKTFPEKARELIRLAKEADPKCRAFGANLHKYELNPTAKLKEVRQFEKEYNIKLPEGFVKYLTEVGNGGAGPDYGLYSLEMLRKRNPYLKQYGCKKAFIDKRFNCHSPDYNMKLIYEEREKICEEYEKAFDLPSDDNEYLNISLNVISGTLNIGTPGCTMSNRMIIDGGENNGRIAVDDSDMDENIPPVLTDYSFEEWFCNYFEKIINGQSILEDNINACNNSFMYYLHERDAFNKESFDEFLDQLRHVTLYDIETYMGLEYVIRQIWRHISYHFNPNDSFEITDLPEDYIKYIEWLEREVNTYKRYIMHNLGDTLHERY